MSQATAAIANISRTLFRAAVNAITQAIQSKNSGLTEPTETYPFMWWADTTTGLLKIRNAADNGWVTILRLSNGAMASVQSQAATAFTTSGSGTAYTLTPQPTIAAYLANQSFFVTFHAAAGAAPTLEISGVPSPPNLVKQNPDGSYSNIAALDFLANHRSRVTLLSAAQAWVETLVPGSRSLAPVRTQTGAVVYNTAVTPIPLDNTAPPLIGEGMNVLTRSFTASNPLSELDIEVLLHGNHSASTAVLIGTVFDSQAASPNEAIITGISQTVNNGGIQQVHVKRTISAGTTTARSFTVNLGSPTGGDIGLNSTGGGAPVMAGTLISSITITERTPA